MLAYDDELPDEDHEMTIWFYVVIDFLQALGLDWKHTRFRNVGDLYGLWARY